MLESDVQNAARCAVNPKRDFSEKLTRPKDFPMIVKDKKPEDGELVTVTLETGAEQASVDVTQKEKEFEKILTLVTLATAESAIPAPGENFNAREDEDSHRVENVDVWEIREETEESIDWDAI